MKILIAEDDNLQRSVLRVLLTKAGHQVTETSDGRQAWEKFEAEPYRLLITDWMMPGMNGVELIQQIRSANLPGYTYILLLTAKDTKDSVVEGLKAGADDYLTKPFDKDELMARLTIGERILDLEARLAYMATHDGLTSLLNRRALYEQIDTVLLRSAEGKTETSFIMMDLDRFKKINDDYGHLVGDEALRYTSKVLQDFILEPACAGRWGGEEFLVVLPGTPLAEASRLAEELRVRIGEIRLPLADGRFLQFTASLGVSSTTWSHPPFERNLLIGQADQALYQAKTAGRNRFCAFGAA